MCCNLKWKENINGGHGWSNSLNQTTSPICFSNGELESQSFQKSKYQEKRSHFYGFQQKRRIGLRCTVLRQRTFHPSNPLGLNVHWDRSVQSVGTAKAVSWAIGHNPGRVTTSTQDTQMAQSSQQAGTRFANHRRTQHKTLKTENVTAWSMNRDPLTEMKVDTLSLPWEDSIPHSETHISRYQSPTHAHTHTHN